LNTKCFFFIQVYDSERLVTYVRSPPLFQHLLTFIRSWAKQVALYGQAYGYLGGYSWATLCAYICHQFFSSMPSLTFIEQFSFEQFFSLVRTFFYTYAQFNWSTDTLKLHWESKRRKSSSSSTSIRNRGSMRILCSSPPYQNTARSTTDSTRDLIHQGFRRAHEILDTVNTITSDDQFNALKKILQMTSDFPNDKVRSLLQLTATATTISELHEWIGWIKSRLVYFLQDCEHECHLNVQTQNFMDISSKHIEASYSFGFSLDEQILMTYRQFPHYLTKFIDQCHSYSSRKDTMLLKYKFFTIHDWKMQYTQPKPQRIRKNINTQI
jgi:poly(A) polymerase Pap1